MSDLFLCHSSKDKEFVRRLATDLQEFSIEAWFDEWELQPGDSLVEVIGQALEESIYIGVVISPSSIDSNWVKRELHQALAREIRDNRKIVLPIKYGDVKMPAFLEDKLFLDFSENYYPSIARLCGMIHLFDTREIAMALAASPPKSIPDVQAIMVKGGNDINKLKTEDGLYLRLRKYAKMAPTVDNLINFGRICFQLDKDAEAKAAFSSALDMESEFTSFPDIDKRVRSLAKDKKPYDLKGTIRIAMSYLGLIDDDEDMILNSAYDTDEREVLVNAGKYYLNTYDADIPSAIAYFIEATKAEPINSPWVRHCDELLHEILSDKKMIYPKFSWDTIEVYVQKWNSHKWNLV